MTKARSNKLSMCKAVKAFFAKWISNISGHIMLNTLKTEFDTLIDTVIAKQTELDTVFEGKTSIKENAKEELLECLIPLGRTVFAFAKRSKKEDVMKIANVKRGYLNSLRENELETKAIEIKELVLQHKTQLADYNITQEEINNLEGKITQFATAADQKDTSFASRVALNAQIDSLFNQIDELLNDEIDGLMEAYKTKDPIFYNEYHTARVIKDLGYHKTNKEETTPQIPAT